MLKALNEFKIPIFNLPLGVKKFDFKIDDTFFGYFDYSIVEKGNFEIEAEINKTESHLEVDFKIDGRIQLTCDLSLEDFWSPVKLDKSLIFKYADSYDASGDELVYIEHGAHEIDLSSFIYEFINLEVPIRKVHPDLEEEDDIEEEGVIFTTDEIKNVSEEEKVENAVDPRWEALKGLNKK